MKSTSFGRATARWTGRRLIVGNDLFSRVWVVRESQLVPLIFEAAGRDWFAETDDGAGLAAPTPPHG